MIRSTRLPLLASVSVLALTLGAAPGYASSVVVNGADQTTPVVLGSSDSLTFTTANQVVVDSAPGALVTINGAGASVDTTNAATTAITSTGTQGGAVIDIVTGGTGATVTNAIGTTITEGSSVNQPVIQVNEATATIVNSGTLTSNSSGPVLNMLGAATGFTLTNNSAGTISSTGSGTAITLANGASGTISNFGTIVGAIDNSANSSGAVQYNLAAYSTTGDIKFGSGGDVVNINGPSVTMGAITGGAGSTGTVNINSSYSTSAAIGTGTAVSAITVADGVNLTANNNVSASTITLGSANSIGATLAIGSATVTGSINSDGSNNNGVLIASGAAVVNGDIGSTHGLAHIVVDNGMSLTTNGNVTATAITLGYVNGVAATLTLGGTGKTVSSAIDSYGSTNNGILVIDGTITTTGALGSLHSLASLTVNDGMSLTANGNITASNIILGSANTTGATLTIGTAMVTGPIDSDGSNNNGILIANGAAVVAGAIGATHGLASITVNDDDSLTTNGDVTATAIHIGAGTLSTSGNITTGVDSGGVNFTADGILTMSGDNKTLAGNISTATSGQGSVDLTGVATAATLSGTLGSSSLMLNQLAITGAGIVTADAAINVDSVVLTASSGAPTLKLMTGGSTIGSIAGAGANLTLTTGTNTVTGNIGSSSNALGTISVGSSTLNTAGNIYASSILFDGAGTVGLTNSAGGQTVAAAITSSSNTGTIVSANTSGVNTLNGSIGASSHFVNGIDLTGAGGTTEVAGVSYVSNVNFSSDATFVESSLSGGSTVSQVTTATNNTGTLRTTNTSGSNIFGSIGGEGVALKAVSLSGTTVVNGNIYATTLTVNDSSTLTAGGGIAGTSVILGDNASGTAAALNLNGSGTIASAINSDSTDRGTLAVNGTYATGSDIGGTHALASTTINNGAIFTLNNNLNSTMTTIASGGEAIIGTGGKTITGALANNGTLNLGSVSTTVTGPVTGNNGTILTTINGTSNGDIVSTNATGPSFTTALTVTPTIDGTIIKSGDKVVLFYDSSAASALPATTVHATSSGLVTWTAAVATAAGTDRYGNAYNPGDIILTAFEPGMPTVAGVNAQATSAVDGLTSYTGTNTNTRTLAAAVQNLATAAQINKAGAQLAPDANGVVQQTALKTVNQALSTVASRNDEVRMAQASGSGISSGEALAGYGFWMQGFGSSGNQGTLSGIDGYSSTTFGTALGGDVRVRRNIRMGASFAFANTNVDDKGTRDGSGLTAKSYIGTLYGTYTGKPWYVDANMSFGFQKYDSHRLIDFTDIPSEVAKGSYNARQYGISTEFGYPFLIASQTLLTPIASFGYTYLDQSAYTETNAPGANLQVNALNTYSAQSGLGARFASEIGSWGGWVFKPNARAVWQHEFNSKAPDQTSSFVAAGGTSFTTAGIKLPQETGIVGIGLDMLSASDWTVSTKYALELREQYVGQGGMLQVRKDF